MVTNSHFAKLVNIVPVTDLNGIQGFKKLYNNIKTRIRSLKALRVFKISETAGACTIQPYHQRLREYRFTCV